MDAPEKTPAKVQEPEELDSETLDAIDKARQWESGMEGISFEEALKRARQRALLELSNPSDFLAVCLAANLDGPANWSENLEQYLYGDCRHTPE